MGGSLFECWLGDFIECDLPPRAKSTLHLKKSNLRPQFIHADRISSKAINLYCLIKYGIKNTPGKVQVSPSTYEQIKGHFDVQENQVIECKGLGQIMTYFVK